MKSQTLGSCATEGLLHDQSQNIDVDVANSVEVEAAHSAAVFSEAVERCVFEGGEVQHEVRFAGREADEWPGGVRSGLPVAGPRSVADDGGTPHGRCEAGDVSDQLIEQ